jgi:hypothetical protein
MDNVANKNGFTPQPRGAWHFRNQIAGYGQRYERSDAAQQSVTLDVLTVKGSGHFVPNDRPGPALQMITNFIHGSGNYSATLGIDIIPAPNDLYEPSASDTVYASLFHFIVFTFVILFV